MNVLCKLHNIIIDGRLDEVNLPNPARPVMIQDGVADRAVGARYDLHMSNRRNMLAKALVDEGYVWPAI